MLTAISPAPCKCNNPRDGAPDTRGRPHFSWLPVPGYVERANRLSDGWCSSQSDIECLDQVIKDYGKLSAFDKRKEACHDQAWEKAWTKRGNKRSVPIPIESIAELFNDPEELIKYIAN